jgi:hypothetical protein
VRRLSRQLPIRVRIFGDVVLTRFSFPVTAFGLAGSAIRFIEGPKNTLKSHYHVCIGLPTLRSHHMSRLFTFTHSSQLAGFFLSCALLPSAMAQTCGSQGVALQVLGQESGIAGQVGFEQLSGVGRRATARAGGCRRRERVTLWRERGADVTARRDFVHALPRRSQRRFCGAD